MTQDFDIKRLGRFRRDRAQNRRKGLTFAAALILSAAASVACETPKGGGGPLETPGAKPGAPAERRPSGVDDVPSSRQPSGRQAAPSAPAGRDRGGEARDRSGGWGEAGGGASRNSNSARDADRNARSRIGLPGGGDDGVPTPRRHDGGGSSWSIVLGTFTGADHAEAAAQTRDRLAERIPEFKAATVRSTPRGSSVVWGRYQGPDDPAAKSELKRVQAYEWQGARPFARAFLTRLEATRKPPTHPLDLRQLRLANPTVDPLQTLQVAVWVDYDGTVPLETIRRNAEAYAGQLRSKGHQAWFHHDDDLVMSVVTIGAWGADAYDSKSTLFLPEIEALMKQYPVMLVNGEPLSVRANAKNKRSPTMVQKPILVMVPPL